MRIFVTLNYRNLSSELKWLIWSEDQNPQESRPCKFVIAKLVNFQLPNEQEKELGIPYILSCQEAFGHRSPFNWRQEGHHMKEIEFTESGFVYKENGEQVEEEMCGTLYFDDKGQILSSHLVGDPSA